MTIRTSDRTLKRSTFRSDCFESFWCVICLKNVLFPLLPVPSKRILIGCSSLFISLSICFVFPSLAIKQPISKDVEDFFGKFFLPVLCVDTTASQPKPKLPSLTFDFLPFPSLTFNF
eukprot:TRINITY_DN5595_c0_g1_i4.p1 TRINITY_DN5595_c0_g1~~TRINITY_DN5595_c0_g1_i4.p1  ORF type:complete len:117 (+),score=10.29 TRINITY_DN5595_c0_g1_i4:381-731(+)